MSDASLAQSLLEQIDGSTLQRMGREVDLDPKQVSRVVEGAIPMLMGGLARNAAQPQGAQALAGALDRDHDGSVLDDLAGFLGGGSGGGAILDHIFGQRTQASVERGLAGANGIDPAKVQQILAMLAPLVMGYLGRQKRQRDLSPSDLGDLLGGERKRTESAAPELGDLFGRIFDADGDGSSLDDLAPKALDVLGGLFGRR